MTESKPSAVTPSAASRAPPVPALLNRQSRRPKYFFAAPMAASMSASAYVAAHIMDQTFVFFLDARALVVLDVGGDHARAFLHEQIHRAAADAAGRAGDDRDLAFQTSRHDFASEYRFD
jgi:hypothetical protein